MKFNIDAKTGVDINSIKTDVIDRYLKLLEISIDGTPLTRLSRLHAVMQLIPDKQNKLGHCSECRGKSHVDLPCCPFCGDSEISNDPETEQARESKSEDTVISELKQLIAKQREIEAKAFAEKAEKDKAKTAPATAPSPVVGQSLVVVPADVLQSKRAKKNAKNVGSDQQTIAVVESPGSTVKREFTIADLDAAVEKMRTHFSKASVEIYDAAIVLFHVFEEKLWMKRTNEDGSPTYPNFGEWAKAEMGFSYGYAYELLDLPKLFTREQCVKTGHTKLLLSLKIEESERKRLLESGDLEKMSVRDVKQAITQNPATQPKSLERTVSRDENGRLQQAGNGVATEIQHLPGGKKPRESKVKASAPASQPRVTALPAPPPRKPEPITLVTCVLPTTIEFDLVANEENKNRPPKRARDLSDDPVAFITCANGARMRIVFMKDTDGYLRGMLTSESPVDGVDSIEGDE